MVFGLSRKGSKILLATFAIIVVALVLVALVVGRFFSNSMQQTQEGFEFGKAHNNQACVDEALRRHVPTYDPTKQVSDSGFVASCLIASKPEPDFCNGVPEFSVLNQAEEISWANAQCQAKGFDDGGCQRIFVQVINHCYMRKNRQDDKKANNALVVLPS